MAEVRVGPQAEEVRGGHWLFVEGDPAKGRDRFVLGELFAGLKRPPRVQALGPSFHVESAARALHPSHPRYCFLVDRDYRFDWDGRGGHESVVEETWKRFPDPDQSNLLIWRRRELENYFLIPDYLARSRYLLPGSAPKLEARIAETAAKRVFLDAANLVIATLREELKQAWIRQFDSKSGFETADSALANLLSREELRSRPGEVGQVLAKDRVEAMFCGFVARMLDGCNSPTLGLGHWLEMVRGSDILPEAVSSCFRVADLQGRVLQGDGSVKAVLKDLLRHDLSEQPPDFQELHALMKAQVERKP